MQATVLGFIPTEFFCLGKKFLVFNLVSRNLKVKYRRSILGIFWTVMAPVAMAMVYYLVFKVILKVSIPHYLAFILSGVLPWNFFSQTLSEGLESIVGNWRLVSKTPIPVQVFPFSGAITNLVTLSITIPVLIASSFASHAPVGFSLVLIPVYFLMLFLIAYSVSLILAISFVYFRDLRHLLSIGLQLWFYASPVVYDISMIPERYRSLAYLNPVSPILVGLRCIFVEGSWPSLALLGCALLWTLCALLLAVFIRAKFSWKLVEQI